MNGLTVLIIAVLLIKSSDCCLPRRTKDLTDSYVPIGLQVLYDYRRQLRDYYPYTFTAFCKVDNKGGKSPGSFPQFPLTKDVCVGETLSRINDLMNDLRREAAIRNLDNYQGFSNSTLGDLEKISQTTSIQQFHFILEKLAKEEFENQKIRCKVIRFLEDLENPNSKFYKNMLNIKPLSYLDWR